MVGNPERKKPLGIPKHIWKDDIKRDLSGKRMEGLNWIHTAGSCEQAFQEGTCSPESLPLEQFINNTFLLTDGSYFIIFSSG
jgi:hypothetical protein